MQVTPSVTPFSPQQDTEARPARPTAMCRSQPTRPSVGEGATQRSRRTGFQVTPPPSPAPRPPGLSLQGVLPGQVRACLLAPPSAPLVSETPALLTRPGPGGSPLPASPRARAVQVAGKGLPTIPTPLPQPGLQSARGPAQEASTAAPTAGQRGRPGHGRGRTGFSSCPRLHKWDRLTTMAPTMGPFQRHLLRGTRLDLQGGRRS